MDSFQDLYLEGDVVNLKFEDNELIAGSKLGFNYPISWCLSEDRDIGSAIAGIFAIILLTRLGLTGKNLF